MPFGGCGDDSFLRKGDHRSCQPSSPPHTATTHSPVPKVVPILEPSCLGFLRYHSVVLIFSIELIKTYIPAPQSRVSDSVDLEWSLRIRVSNKFPSDVGDAAPGTTLWEPLV